MYSLDTKVSNIDNVGPVLTAKFAEAGMYTVKDLLLKVPLRYEDRSHLTTIAELVPDQLVTVEAVVTSISSFYRNRKQMVTVMVEDETGKLKLMWFRNSYISRSIKKGESYLISGKYTKYKTMVHPTLERVGGDTIHTNRIVPLYTTTLDIKQGSLRRILKSVCDGLAPTTTVLDQFSDSLLSIESSLKQLHFPDAPELVTAARQRLATEELVSLILKSQALKEKWSHQKQAIHGKLPFQECLPENLPFELTNAQKKCAQELLDDCEHNTPMNRLLLGDVGSGKTIVAGIAMNGISQLNAHSCLIAPTQVLAEQHVQTLSKFFPHQPIQLITGSVKKAEKIVQDQDTPTWFVGTHAVLNFVDKQEFSLPVGMIIYDEQHRFGVRHRSHLSDSATHNIHPHILTMTATPIPRSLLLTIFSHLDISIIDELPKNRLPTKTWITPEFKREQAYNWLENQIKAGKDQGQPAQAILVCPFIETSDAPNFAHIPSATLRHEELTKFFKKSDIRVGFLHGRMKATQKQKIISDMFDQKIDLLITTTIVEVGVDLPQASAIIIEASERYGLATLHQLRGRVGRAGQQGYCMLFTSSEPGLATKQRLQLFTETLNGIKLAEYDLKNRGAGDIFGTEQHGFDQLEFASWSDQESIKFAKDVAEQISAKSLSSQDLLFSTSTESTNNTKVAAN